MKKLLIIIISTIALLSSYESKAQYDGLKFGDYGIDSVSPVSFTAVAGSVWVEVENPLAGFTVSQIEGKLYRNGVALIQGSANDYYVPTGKSKITITGRASLCPGTSIFDVLGLILFNPEDYTFDIKAVVTDDGADSVIKEVKDIPVLTLLKKENKDGDKSSNSK